MLPRTSFIGESNVLNSRDLALHVARAAIDHNALDPILLDTAQLSSYTDFILVVSGRSMRQVEAIAEKLQGTMKEAGEDPIGIEGQRGAQWMLLDYGDVVVHVFYHPVRAYYDIEGLWSEAARVELDVPPEQRVAGDYCF